MVGDLRTGSARPQTGVFTHLLCTTFFRRPLLSNQSLPYTTAAKMSLQGLISGAECAVPFNPLSQVLKHTDGDRSLQQVCGPRLCQDHHGLNLNIC